MATMYVSYYGGSFMGVAHDPIGSTTITTSGATAKTDAAAPDGAQIVGVISDAAHYVNIGAQASVTATAANGVYVPANQERLITISPGSGVAAITV